MSDESVNNAEEGPEETVTAEAPPEDSGAGVPARPVSEKELVKEIKDQDVARTVTELLRGQRIASIFIDTRSGGVYFEGEGPIHIEGDVVGGDQIKTSQQTHFHGPVTGPVHTGSGDIGIDYTPGEAVAVGVEKDSGNVIVVEPESSTVIAGVPKQAAYERIAAAANATRQQLTQIYEQSRQQAADWTRFSLVAAVLGFLIVLGGIVTMLLGNTTVGLVTTAVSLIPEVAAGLFFQQARGANRRVDENQERLLWAEGIHQVIELVITIDDEGTRDRLKGTIILNALGLSGAGEILTTPASESDG